MLHCRPRCQYTTDYQEKQHFLRVWFNIWDDRDSFDPEAVRRNEEYDDIDQAIARLDEIGNDASFDVISRQSSSMLANRLKQFKRGGSLNSRERQPREDLMASLNEMGIVG